VFLKKNYEVNSQPAQYKKNKINKDYSRKKKKKKEEKNTM
jgi:hypothetical protein